MSGIQYPGEYPQPLIQTTTVQAPIVPEYATARLGAIPTLIDYGTTPEIIQTRVDLENVGATDVEVVLQETDDYVSGPRYALSPAIPLQPLGLKTFDVFPQRQYVEIWGAQGSNEGQLKARFTGRIRWQIMAFDKTDPTYPAKLWQATYTAWNSL